MKPIVVYYSRTGNTRTVAKALAKRISCKLLEIQDKDKRSGMRGYIRSARETSKGKLADIEDIDIDLKEYDLVIVGGPVWMYTACTPVVTFLTRYKKSIKNAAFFCTHGGNFKNTFVDMEKLLGKAPKAIMDIRDKKIKKDDYDMEDFVKTCLNQD